MDKIYRVRIEEYDPETDKTEVLLSEDEDDGYTGFMFFGKETVDDDGKGGLRSVVQHLTTLDAACIMREEEMFQKAIPVVQFMEALRKEKKDAT